MTDSLKERLQAAALYGAPISYDIVREAAQAISTLEAEREAQDRELARVETAALNLMAEKDARVAALEAERDRLEDQLANIRAAANVLSWNPKTREIAEQFQSLAALNPTVCLALIARARDAERLEDKVDGLTADLREAVEVAFLRGATEWVRLNYPADFKRLSALNEGGPANG